MDDNNNLNHSGSVLSYKFRVRRGCTASLITLHGRTYHAVDAPAGRLATGCVLLCSFIGGPGHPTCKPGPTGLFANHYCQYFAAELRAK